MSDDEIRPFRIDVPQAHKIVRWTEFDRGGHFAAMDEPGLADLRASFRAYR